MARETPSRDYAQRRQQEEWARFHRETLQSIKIILADHAIVYQGGPSFINMEEMGVESSGMPINAACIRRYFQDHPKEMKAVGRYFLDSQEAESHLLIEGKLEEWRRYAPWLAGPIDDVHFRSTAGHSDADYQLELWAAQAQRNTISHTKSQRRDAWEAQHNIHNYYTALNNLAWWCTVEGIDIYATRTTRKAIRDSDANDLKHDVYYERYKELADKNTRVKDIYAALSDEYGLSVKRLQEIIAARRVLAGEKPRKPGRPKKKPQTPFGVHHQGNIWVRLSKDCKAYEIGSATEVLRRVPLVDLAIPARSPSPEEYLHAKLLEHVDEVAGVRRVKRFAENLKQRKGDT